MNNPHRSFPVGTADKISEWSETNRGHALPQWQIDLLRQMEIQPMTTPDIQQAKEWAESRANGNYILSEETQAAARVIQSLPDHWIDADKVREVLDRWAENPFPTSDEVAVLNDFEALLTPSLPTLADMTPEERQACQWMQCEIDGGLAGILAREDGQRGYLWSDSGHTFGWKLENITPLPDLPKLEWPGDDDDHESEYCPVCGATLLDDGPECGHCRKHAALPRPEDVPAGEPWIVLCGGKRWVGVHADTPDRPWSITRMDMDGLDYQNVADSEIALISRLVPEVKP